MIERNPHEVYDFLKEMECEENTAKIAIYKNIDGKMLVEAEYLY